MAKIVFYVLHPSEVVQKPLDRAPHSPEHRMMYSSFFVHKIIDRALNREVRCFTVLKTAKWKQTQTCEQPIFDIIL